MFLDRIRPRPRRAILNCKTERSVIDLVRTSADAWQTRAAGQPNKTPNGATNHSTRKGAGYMRREPAPADGTLFRCLFLEPS